MQIIQPLLGTQVNPLGQKYYLGYHHQISLQSNINPVRQRNSSFIKPLVTAKPLFPTSKLFLARKRQPFIDTLVADGYDLDNSDIDTDFSQLELETSNPPLETNTSDKLIDEKFDISNISNFIQKQITNDISDEILTKTSTKTGKQPNQKLSTKKTSPSRSTNKSQRKQANKSSISKRKTQIFDETPILPQTNERNILTTDNLQAEVYDNSVMQPSDSEIATTNNTVENNQTLNRKANGNSLPVTNDMFANSDNGENKKILNQNSVPDIDISNSLEDLALETELAHSSDNINVTKGITNPKYHISNKTPENIDSEDISVHPDDSQAQADSTIIMQSNPVRERNENAPESITLKTEAHILYSHNILKNIIDDNSNTELDIKQNLPLLNNDTNKKAIEIKSLASETILPKSEDKSNSSIHLDNTQKHSIVSNVNYFETEVTSANKDVVPQNAINTPQKININNPIPEYINNEFVEFNSELPSIENQATANHPIDTPDVTSITSSNSEYIIPETNIKARNIPSNEVQGNTASLTPIQPNIFSSTTPEIENTNTIEDANTTALPTITPVATSSISSHSEETSTLDLDIVTSETGDIVLTNPTEDLLIIHRNINNEQIIPSESDLVVNNFNLLNFINDSDTSENTLNTDPPDNIDNTTNINLEPAAILNDLPAPKGYATGGQVTATSLENHQPVAPSDTVPAMLTPGEFVINAKDTEKNLQILKHINTGGSPEEVISPSLEVTSSPTPQTNSLSSTTKVDSFGETPIQRQSLEPETYTEPTHLNSPSLGVEIGKQRRSLLNHPQDTIENTTHVFPAPSPQYSSPSLIFRKIHSTSNTQTPSQWSSVEELLNANNHEFTNFNFDGVEGSWQNSPSSQFASSSTPTHIFTKRFSQPQGYANGGEVIAPDISRDIAPITETIQSPNSSSSTAENDDNEDGAIEALAQAVYYRLRQRIEIEKERQGIYVGRLPW
ncbi:hypothetical protein NOS3756_10340 [Nostoc sp. NIES-3756]|uniref:hypothetical protein n=1 Tax=Nostoc sp. NIES-3756 TaxID=1751286 RepID=UPI000720BFF0|nr:hypothetical protein [Nostoc sp. NIES-3756]BAT52103.1 hypothetical protein NOS3756_10340 [Nostoc sp. NIES-3756]